MLDIYLSDMDRVVEDVGLSDSAHKLGGEPSGGQRNQLSLAVAVLGLLLADGSPNELRDRIGSRPRREVFLRLCRTEDKLL